MKQVKYFDVYTNDRIKRYSVDSTEEYECYVRLLKYDNKDTVVTHIVYDDGTHEYIDMPIDIHIKIKQATKKALADFIKLSALDKYKECVHYGSIITSIDMKTTDGWLTLKTFEIYGIKFIFVLLSGEVINCYELQ